MPRLCTRAHVRGPEGAEVKMTHTVRGADYREWRDNAQALKVAAEAVFERSIGEGERLVGQLAAKGMHDEEGNLTQAHYEATMVAPVALMLAGMALENLVKALFVQKQNSTVTAQLAKGKLPRSFTHSIKALAARAEIPLSVDEASLLEKLEIYVVWLGRYPVPKTAAKDLLTWGYGAEEINRFRILYARLDQTLLRRSEDAPPHG
jgi:hypothetical protein